jgi:hypothetical protein
MVPSLRQRFTVSWDDGEPVTILTTVQDLINAVDRVAANGSANNRIAMHAALMYSALERLEHKVPPYDEWVNLLDTYEEVPASNGADGPTQPDPLPPELSLSPVSQEQIGEAGLTSTPEP